MSRVSPLILREYVVQATRLTTRSLLPVLAVVIPFGFVIGLQSSMIVRNFGVESVVSNLLAAVLIRELAPCLTAIMIAAQSGSSIASEIGAMRVKEEIDALVLIGVSPFRYLVLPRLVGVVFSSYVINLLAIISGVLGGFLSSYAVVGIAQGVFWDSMLQSLSVKDLAFTSIKSVCFGVIIGATASYFGMKTTGGAEGVGKSVNTTVVYAIVTFIVVNFFLSQFLLFALGLL